MIRAILAVLATALLPRKWSRPAIERLTYKQRFAEPIGWEEAVGWAAVLIGAAAVTAGVLIVWRIIW